MQARRWKLIFGAFAALALPACGLPPPGGGEEPVFSDTSPKVDLCARYLQFGAFVGDEALTTMWEENGSDLWGARQTCRHIGDDDPGQLDLMAAAMTQIDEQARSAGNQTNLPTSDMKCHPSYAGRCVPVGQMVNCPQVGGTVQIVGPDPYELDTDGDGLGCEPPDVPTAPPTAPPTTLGCHPSYTGACVPIKQTVNCPEIGVPVQVVGPDYYELDTDDDGIGCESEV
jgi:hypothetical protein